MSKNYNVSVILQGKYKPVLVNDIIPAENKKEAERSFIQRFSNYKILLVMATSLI